MLEPDVFVKNLVSLHDPVAEIDNEILNLTSYPKIRNPPIPVS